jgi:hypothetical protein
MGVMQKPVEGGCCYRIISHDFSPFSKDFVAGQNDRSMLVARIYELEEQGRLFTLLSGKCNDPGSARELTHLNPSRL